MATPTWVQDPTGTSGTAITELSLSFGSNTTSGNLVVVVTGVSNATDTTSSVADNKSNSYSLITRQQNSTRTLEMWYAKNISGGASHQVTATYSASTTGWIHIIEIAGADTTAPLDTGGGSGGYSQFANSTDETTHYFAADGAIDTSANVLAVAALMDNESRGFTVGGSWVELDDFNNLFVQYLTSESALVDERGAATNTNACRSAAIIAAFKLQAAAAGHPLPQRVLVGPTVGPFRGPF